MSGSACSQWAPSRPSSLQMEGKQQAVVNKVNAELMGENIQQHMQ
jgi:hypothetical protein